MPETQEELLFSELRDLEQLDGYRVHHVMAWESDAVPSRSIRKARTSARGLMHTYSLSVGLNSGPLGAIMV